MPELFVYLLQVNLGIALFYMAYRLFLRRLTFYTLNRYFLLLGLVFSVVYPLVKHMISWLRPTAVQQADWAKYIPDWEQLNEKTKQLFTGWDVALLAFWCVVLFFFMRFLIRLHGLWRIHKSSMPGIFQQFHFRQVLLNINPFSFWRYIYLNSTKHEPLELKNILVHEQVHTEQLHTADVLLGELISIVFWFNPFSWLFRMAIKENLEFITDREVLLQGADKRTYQYSLLKVLNTADQPLLANNFNLRNLKRRIMMMNRQRSNKAKLTNYIIITPVIVLFILTFTISKAYEKGMEGEIIGLIKQSVPTAVAPTLDKEIPAEDTIIIRPKKKSMEVKRDTLPVLNLHLHSDKDPVVYLNGEYIGTGSKHLEDMDPSEIQSINVLKGSSAIKVYGPKAYQGAIEITTKKQRILADSSSTTKPDTAKIRLRQLTYTPQKPIDASLKIERITYSEEGPLFVIDDVVQEKEYFRNINPNDILSIDVLKDSPAVARYGEKGKNGVVSIKLRKEDDKANTAIFQDTLGKRKLIIHGSATYTETEDKRNKAKPNLDTLKSIVVMGYKLNRVDSLP
ncbi:M56 family metallopeptidase [Olivibacter sitiensis]|uniref:M56 family metallopeptidase n=1 Tax=Olivibacter sitiensis TaxID=376470 RepID=UPI000485A28F|nr:M56 family metallopeptidase [Olivibacter sitiensis]